MCLNEHIMKGNILSSAKIRFHDLSLRMFSGFSRLNPLSRGCEFLQSQLPHNG